MKGSSIKRRRKTDYLIIPAGILGLAFLITVLFFQNWDAGFRDLLLSYTWSVVICATQWLGNSYIYRLLDKKYSWQEHLVKRAIYGSLALIVYSASAFVLVQMIMFKLVSGSLPENPIAYGLRSSFFAILISFIVSLIFVAVAFFQNWKNSLLEAERFKAEMLTYKYEALQNQINPHFLFNSFNVLSDLVYEDQTKAVGFIRQLSQLFRYVLDSRDTELVPLKEELNFIEAYTYLLHSRFEEKLSIKVDIKAADHEMIVPMSLQLLIENCVKHNEISASQPLHVHISRNGDYLKVENRLQPKPGGNDSKQTGLSNIRQQFKYFTNKEILVTQTDHTFSVELPVLTLGTS